MNPTEFPVMLALDVPTQAEALDWVRRLKSRIGIYKIGMQLFYAHGPEMVRQIRAEGVEVFLDLKLHDIPNTVEHACESLRDLDVLFLTLHASGGRAMMQAAAKAMQETRTRLLGVTALTSLDSEALKDILPAGQITPPSEWAVQLAGVVQQAGLWGVVCSAQENPAMRQAWGESLGLVNPGIRPTGSDVQDQKRVQTPADAMRSGGNYLVIGRPILQATDPLGVTEKLYEELAGANCLSA